MTDQTKKSFILSVKRLHYFFNHIKEFEGGANSAVESRANIQSCSESDMNNVSKFMEEATLSIAESKRFIALIENQENVKYGRLVKEKQQIIDGQAAEINDLETQISDIQYHIEEKQFREHAIREDIERDNRETEEEMKRIDAEIAEIQRKKAAFITLEEGKIDEVEGDEDIVRDLYHRQRNQLVRAEENNTLMYFFPQRVAYMGENIERKKDELQLYQSIISESLTFLRNKIRENKEKQILVRQMNEQVSTMVANTIVKEQQFYESDTYDKLKVPPHVLVKRLER